MNTKRNIPESLQDKVAAMPEYKYGVNRIKVTLNNGEIYNDVHVAWGEEIVKVGNSEHIPFDPAKIVAIENQ